MFAVTNSKLFRGNGVGAGAKQLFEANQIAAGIVEVNDRGAVLHSKIVDAEFCHGQRRESGDVRIKDGSDRHWQRFLLAGVGIVAVFLEPYTEPFNRVIASILKSRQKGTDQAYLI